jgi:hypothetical protein
MGIDRIAAAALLAALVLPASLHAQRRPAAGGGGETTFTVRVENVSTPSTLRLPSGGGVAIPISPGVWVVHTGANPIFTPGAVEPGLGLKGLAEAGLAAEFAPNLRTVPGVRSTGAFETPIPPLVRRMGPGGMPGAEGGEQRASARGSSRSPASRMLQPRHRFEFMIQARPGDRLSIATMLAQSNDGFIAPGPDGIALFDSDGLPISGDVTAQLLLWDAGTEINEEPGLGRRQGLRQGAPHAGDPERRPVRPMSAAEFGDRLPPADGIVRVTLIPSRR